MPNPFIYTLDRQLNRDELLATFAEIPARVRALIAAAPAGSLSTARPGEWSPFQVLVHLRDAGMVYSSRFRFMVLNDNPVLVSFDEGSWVRQSLDTPEDVPAILDHLAAMRADIVRMLSRMPAEAWTRTGQHDVAGEIELEEYVRHQLAHEEQHVAQMAAALAPA